MITVTNPQRDPNDLTGQQVGGSFRIVRLLGVGGMGQVWLAEASELDGKEAAVKVLLQQVGDNPEHLARFKTEVRAVGGLRDNNVVEIWDAGRLADGRHYMIMEFCSGGSLASLIAAKGGKLSIEETFMFTAGPAAALAAAHAAKVIHRDFKPDNILLVPEDGRLRAKLGDFGIAKLNLESTEAQYRTGTMKTIGTPGFMAPEQLHPKERIDARADIYSFGCVLYLCLTGRCPYPPNNFFEYVEAMMSRTAFPRPSTLRPEIAPALDGLIMDCLAHDRSKRIPTIEGVMSRFAAAVPNGETLLRFFAPRFVSRATGPKSITISQSVGVAATDFVSAMSLSVDQARRRSTRVAVAAFFAGAVLSGGAVALATRPGSASTPEPSARIVAQPSGSATAAPLPSSPAPVAAPAVAVVVPVIMVDAGAPDADGHVIMVAAGGSAVAVVARDAGVDAAALASEAPIDASPARHVAAVDAISKPPKPAAPPPGGPLPGGGSLAAAAKPERAAEKKPASVAGQGTIHIEVDPWADVTIGDWQDTTPVTRKLPAGHHRVVLKKGPRTEAIDVTINPNQTTSITRSW
jgi:eukaryotic-like serine/threonine-protein kinase